MRTLFLTLLTGLFICLSFGPAAAQPAQMRHLSAAGFGNQLRVLPTPDGGWALFSPDSLKLAKFSACGRQAWGFRYRPAGMITNSWPVDMICLRQGDFVFTTRQEINNLQTTLITRLSSTGQVRWSRLLQMPDYDQYPYSLSEDVQGNLALFGNIEHVNLSPSYNLFCKISPTGTLLWARRYDLGGIWGSAIATSDGGYLLRTGSRFIRTDDTGQVRWATAVVFNGDGTYFAPHEVTDGFIFSSGQGQNIRFHKLDHQGNLQWGGGRQFTFGNVVPKLRALPNGHFAVLANQLVGGRTYPVVTEFEADLNAGTPHALVSALAASGTDLQVDNAGTAHLTGWLSEVPGSFFFARADSLRHFACDSLFSAPSYTATPATQQMLSVATAPLTLSVTAQNVFVTPVSLNNTPACAPLRTLELGADTLICPGTALTLRNQFSSPFEHYKWSTGATTAAVTVRQSGVYWVRAYFDCGLDSLTDTLRVTVRSLPTPAPATDTLLCENTAVTLDAQVAEPATYRWNNGAITPQLVVADTGNYFVDITTSACTQRFHYHVGECEQLLMPNIFTPTADAVNERLLPIRIRGIGAASLELYNRWGRRVYTTDELRQGWDGQSAGAGTYFWFVRYTTFRGWQKTAKGWVELVR